MSTGTITDPDLVQAIDDLRYTVGRLEQMDRLIHDLDETEGYQRLVKMKSERADLHDKIRIRAEKLSINPRALALIVSTANRLRTARKFQLPTLQVVFNHIEILADAAGREQLEAEAEAKLARVMARGAGLRAKAGADALTYLNLSAG